MATLASLVEALLRNNKVNVALHALSSQAAMPQHHCDVTFGEGPIGMRIS